MNGPLCYTGSALVCIWMREYTAPCTGTSQFKQEVHRSNRMLSGVHCRLENPPWNLGSLAFATTLILTLVCKGTLSQDIEYSLTVTNSVMVAQDFCVHVPCNFTIPEWYKTSPAPLYIYWLQISNKKYYLKPNYWVRGHLVATNDKAQRTSGRFLLTGDPDQGDCSFSVLKTQPGDGGWYYLRIDKGTKFRFSYTGTHERHYPVVWAKPLTISCNAPAICRGPPPQISWLSVPDRYIQSPWNYQRSQWSWDYGSNITFTPILADQGKVIHCKVVFPSAANRTRLKPLRLSFAYGPRLSHQQTNSTCQRKDIALLCTCSLHSWPPPQIQWKVDEEIINETSTIVGQQITSRTEGNEVTSFLNWTNYINQSHIIICFGSNPFGNYSVQLTPIKSLKGVRSKWFYGVISGIVIGTLVLLVIVGMLLSFTYRAIRRRRPRPNASSSRAPITSSHSVIPSHGEVL
ncbi:sialic acid-binding Ig-like lectin 10 isoform X2 [Hemicordylus capensis]|uniref:sialic acid-binding Ig-like lectin 10 isoform X2 n=1 Tax=Hemicordylus capensis TaxID=884348 RepID=UPI002301FE63|nr:sialic acid-binding Ig-like lectin 10 isoform X2 [Hemicordylus capensis]